MKNILLLFCTIFTLSAYSQLIDNTASYRTIQADRYFRLHYENDYFSEADYYYTQGINIEYVNPGIRKLPVSHLLIKGDVKSTKYGISLEHLGFTPTSISHPEILQGDRPFAAAIFLKTFSIVNDSLRGHRIVSALSTGVIGPAAGGMEMQQTIHRWIHDTDPLGWNNQIQNDLVLNYQLDVEKRLSYGEYFSSTAKAGTHLGTLSDKIYGSISIMTGLFDNPFQYFTRQHKLFQVYIFEEPVINAVGYDASLQGGLFNHSSPYIISSGDVTRFVFQNNMGLMLKIRKFSMEYFQSFVTKEFRTGSSHHFGGIRIGWSLRRLS